MDGWMDGWMDAPAAYMLVPGGGASAGPPLGLEDPASLWGWLGRNSSTGTSHSLSFNPVSQG